MENLSKKLEEICEKHPDKVAKEFKNFLEDYISPSFGSMPKNDINIKIFNIMRNLGLISENPDAWEVTCQLRMKRTTANNLIYDADIRREGTFNNIDNLFKDVIRNAPYDNKGDYVLLQIENHLLIDRIRTILSEAKFIPDRSFYPEIIKITPKAYMYLYVYSLDYEQKENLNKKLEHAGLIQSVKNIADGLFKIAEYLLDGSKGEAISSAFKTLKGMWNANNDELNVENFFNLLEEEKKKAC